MSRMRVGRPTALRCASTRAASWPEQSPSWREKRNARGHADRDALAVHEARRIVVGQALEGVAEGVAEIEQRALALLGLVGDDDARLGGATRRDRLGPRRTAGEDVAPAGLQEFEESPVADQAVFDHLGVAGAELALAQRVEAPESASTRDG